MSNGDAHAYLLDQHAIGHQAPIAHQVPIAHYQPESLTRYQNALAENEERHPCMHEAWKSLGRCFGGYGGCICLFLLFAVFVVSVRAITG